MKKLSRILTAILLCFAILCPVVSKAQDSTVTEIVHKLDALTSTVKMVMGNVDTIKKKSKDLDLSIGTVKTVLKDKAINFGISYLKKLADKISENDFVVVGDNYGVLLTPDLNIESGSADAFSSITARMTGLAVLFNFTEVAGIPTPDLSGTFHTIPFSAGIETNGRINIINGLAEVGWVPWLKSKTKKGTKDHPDILQKLKFGVFVQAGYKFQIDRNRTGTGGDMDQSKEAPNSGLLRTKASFKIDTKSLISFKGVGVGIAGSADGWYDVLNSAFYYRVDGKLRIYLVDDATRFFDLKYQKGSGAPNFNTGSQFGIGLTLMF